MRGVFLLAGLAVVAGPARAEFRIVDQPPPLVAGQSHPSDSVSVPRPRPTAPRAEGFGIDVPLDVAARQMVPAGIKVEFGAGVSPDAAVTWRGGRPWPGVVRDAIKPLGYRLQQAGDTARIVR